MHDMLKPLERALAVHDDLSTAATGQAVIVAARHLIQELQMYDHYLAYLAEQRLDPGQLEKLL